ncbi:MAG TPA: hypothetical protein VGO92_04375 [Acidimicrobiales bacterium]|jgi:hypothetical protein|nr:hypothetical protein [Acidimicrobiales bacterium]
MADEPRFPDVPGLPASSDLPALLDFACPRCGAAASLRVYGPCEGCRGELRASQVGAARVVEAEAYEPKMNVTPNQVATKD